MHDRGSLRVDAHHVTQPRWRDACGARRVARWMVLAAVSLTLIVGTQAAETWLCQRELAHVAARAVDQAQLGILSRLTAADFEPPFPRQRLDELRWRLDPLMARMADGRRRVIRQHIHARDGTIIYSDDPSELGLIVPPETVPPMAAALHGLLGTRISSLADPDDADIRLTYHSALEAHVPLVLDGTVVGVYQMYEEADGIAVIRLIGWGLMALSVLIMLLPLAPLARAGAWLARQAGIARAGEAMAERGASPAARSLTPREQQVLELMASGLMYREIAERLTVSEETVRTHAKNILRKLGQTSRTQAVLAAVRDGLVALPEFGPPRVTPAGERDVTLVLTRQSPGAHPWRG